MAETVLHITRVGSLGLEPDTVLRYDDTRDVVAHTGEVLVYRAQGETAGGSAYHVQMPLTADAEVTLLREFHTLQQLTDRARGLPQAALAQQTGTINTGLVTPVYETLLSEVIQAHLASGQFLLAERTALRAAIDYTAIVDSLRTLDPPRSCISHKTTDFFMHEGQVIVPGWHTLVEATGEALASEISLFGQIWHALFLEKYGTAPLYPFNDECWQSDEMPEGVVSIGLRTLIAASVQAAPEKRFVDAEGRASHTVLCKALNAWQERLLQTPDELETLDAWTLYGFVELLPDTHTRSQINAMWQDLRWRVNRAAGLLSDTLYTSRSQAVNAARETIASEDPYERRQRTFKATGEYPVVIDQITAPEGLAQFKERVISGEFNAANWLYHHLLREAASEVEREWITRELEPYTRYMQFMLRYDDVAVLMVTPAPPVLIAAEVVLNDTRIDDKSALHRVIVQCATMAFLRLEEAVRSRSWKVIQEAQSAWRVFVMNSRERAVIDRVRPLFPDAMRFEGLDALLERYELMQKTYARIFQAAQADPLRRISGTTQTAAMTRVQALETLALLNSAQEMGLEMSEIVDSDEQTRHQWQLLIQDAMLALKQVDTVRTDIDTLRAGIDRVDSMAADVVQLKREMQGREDMPGLWQQVIDIEKRVTELQYAPGESRARLTADVNEVRHQIALVEKELREHASAFTRFTQERTPRVDRLLDDLKERFEKTATALERAAAYEESLLAGYLEWLAKQPDPETTEGALEAVDELVYALRRCPVEAYTPALHEAWLQAFRRYQYRFEQLSQPRPGMFRLRGRRRHAEEERRAVLEKLSTCEAEAMHKAAGHAKLIE